MPIINIYINNWYWYLKLLFSWLINDESMILIKLSKNPESDKINRLFVLSI